MSNEKPIVNIVRAEIVTREASPRTLAFDTASEATYSPVTSEGTETVLRSKNTIHAINRTEDIQYGTDITFSDALFNLEVMAIIDGGTVTKTTVPQHYELCSASDENALNVVTSASEENEVAYETVKAQTSPVDLSDIASDGTAYVKLVAAAEVPTSYTAPEVGSVVNRISFDLNVYTEEKDINGDTKSYIKFTFPFCKGKPVNYSFKDGEFMTPQYTCSSRPAKGQAPFSMTTLTSLPTT